MSYILDALKKTEQEKIRKARAGGISGISGELFDEAPVRPSSFLGWKAAVMIIILAVAVTFAVTWFTLRPSRQITPQAPIAPVVQPPVSPVREPAPAAPPLPAAPLATPVPSVSPAAGTPPPPAKAKTIPVAAPALTPGVGKIAPVKTALTTHPAVKAETVKPLSDDAAARLTILELGKRTSGRKLTADQMIAPPADIVLSGIAWQDERRARRAVVNGFLMQEGGIVSGARIVEIYQDRVRFSLSGKFFDLNLVSAAAPAPAK